MVYGYLRSVSLVVRYSFFVLLFYHSIKVSTRGILVKFDSNLKPQKT